MTGSSASRYRVVKKSRGNKAPTAKLARSKCGKRVLGKSVYVRLAPRGITCGSCRTGYFVVKFRSGGWYIWFAD